MVFWCWRFHNQWFIVALHKKWFFVFESSDIGCIWINFEWGKRCFHDTKRQSQTMILEWVISSYQMDVENNIWFSCFSRVLDLQNSHPRYVKLSTVTGECFQISWRSISDVFQLISSKESGVFSIQKDCPKQWFSEWVNVFLPDGRWK